MYKLEPQFDLDGRLRLGGSSERGYRWSHDLVSIVGSKERWACACAHLLVWCSVC